MKKFIPFVIAYFLSATVLGQIHALDAPATVYGGYNDHKLESHFEVHNIGSGTISVNCARIEVSMVDGATSSFCWGVLCHPPSISISQPIVLTANELDSSFIGYYYPHGNAGISTITWNFYEPSDSANTWTPVTIEYDASFPEGVNDVSKMSSVGAAYPNPADKTTAVRFNHSGTKGEIVLFDMLGAEVKRVALQNKEGVAILGTSELKSGVYFYAFNVDGKIVSTKKLVVAHK